MKREKGTNPFFFCELGLTEDQNVLQESGGEEKSQENMTKSYQGGILCKCSSSHIKKKKERKTKQKNNDTRREVKTNGGLCYLPLSKTGSNGALLMVLLEVFTLVSNDGSGRVNPVQTGDLFITKQLVVGCLPGVHCCSR